MTRELSEAKPWTRDIELLRRETAETVEECRTDLSKGVVACQSRLSQTRLTLQEKVAALEEKLSGIDLNALKEHVKDVNGLREFTLGQASKLHNAIGAEFSNLDAKVEKNLNDIRRMHEELKQEVHQECDGAREFSKAQAQEAQMFASKLHEMFTFDLSKAVDKAKASSSASFGDLRAEIAQVKQRLN